MNDVTRQQPTWILEVMKACSVCTAFGYKVEARDGDGRVRLEVVGEKCILRVEPATEFDSVDLLPEQKPIRVSLDKRKKQEDPSLPPPYMLTSLYGGDDATRRLICGVFEMKADRVRLKKKHTAWQVLSVALAYGEEGVARYTKGESPWARTPPCKDRIPASESVESEKINARVWRQWGITEPGVDLCDSVMPLAMRIAAEVPFLALFNAIMSEAWFQVHQLQDLSEKAQKNMRWVEPKSKFDV
jgi:hypothetical protein